MSYIQKILEESKKQKRDIDIGVSPTEKPKNSYISPILSTSRIANEEVVSTKSYQSVKNDPTIRETAGRFAKDHL